MSKRLIPLVVAVMAVSIAVIQLRQESRELFAQLQTQRAERDALNVEWGKLLLEEGAWSQRRRIEAIARQRLNMSAPDAAHIRVVRIDPGPKP